jgi:hypothetical protein
MQSIPHSDTDLWDPAVIPNLRLVGRHDNCAEQLCETCRAGSCACCSDTSPIAGTEPLPVAVPAMGGEVDPRSPRPRQSPGSDFPAI